MDVAPRRLGKQQHAARFQHAEEFFDRALLVDQVMEVWWQNSRSTELSSSWMFELEQQMSSAWMSNCAISFADACSISGSMSMPIRRAGAKRVCSLPSERPKPQPTSATTG